MTILGAVIFFFASADACSASFTKGEVSSMETQALCIAFLPADGPV